jgi:N-acetylneuraminate lyase
MKKSYDSLTGLIAATYTPMLPGGDIDTMPIPSMVDFLHSQGITGLYVLGSTGEGPSLTVDERYEVAEAFVKAANGRLPVIIQVGSESLRQSQLLAEHAQKIGADAISAVSPVYFKPDSLDSLVEFMKELASAAPDLPYYYYHIPTVTGVACPALEFLRSAAERIPTLGGLKFSSTVLYEYQACLEFAPDRLEVLFGSDEMLLGAIALGGRGAVGSTYNFAAPVYRRMLDAWQAGHVNDARQYQSHAQALVRAFVAFGARAAQKAIMSMIGYPCGPSRLPIPEFSKAQYDGLKAELTRIGYFEWIR